MPNLMIRGQTFLSNRLRSASVAGVLMTYERPGQFDISILIRIGDEEATAVPIGTTQKPRRQDAERDYLLAIADLKTPALESFLPRKGDRITETINGVVCTFEVTPGENEPAWRYSDPQRMDIRLHTKRVS